MLEGSAAAVAVTLLLLPLLPALLLPTPPSLAALLLPMPPALPALLALLLLLFASAPALLPAPVLLALSLMLPCLDLLAVLGGDACTGNGESISVDSSTAILTNMVLPGL